MTGIEPLTSGFKAASARALSYDNSRLPIPHTAESQYCYATVSYNQQTSHTNKAWEELFTSQY